jgi:acyl carrier protein
MNPVNNDIRPRLEAVFREVFDDDTLQLTDAVDRESLEAWDSLGHIRLVSSVEETFGITFTLDEIETMISVPQILELVASRY